MLVDITLLSWFRERNISICQPHQHIHLLELLVRSILILFIIVWHTVHYYQLSVNKVGIILLCSHFILLLIHINVTVSNNLFQFSNYNSPPTSRIIKFFLLVWHTTMAWKYQTKLCLTNELTECTFYQFTIYTYSLSSNGLIFCS